MAFSFSEEQDQFREMVARFMADKSPPTAVRRLMESDDGFDAGVWRQLCGELGLGGLHLPEAYGGSGFGPVELGIALEEQGRALLCAPFLSSAVMAGYAILLAGNEEQKGTLLPKIADGTVLAAFGVSEAGAMWTADDIQTRARPAEGGFMLDGVKRFVVNGMQADILVVAARSDKGVSFFQVEAGASGLERTAAAPMDPTRKMADLAFRGTPATLLGDEGAAPLEDVTDAVLVAFAHEMMGGAQALLNATLDYARLRVQFGRAIGSFQAIKHRCTDVFLSVELARATAYLAAQILAGGEPATAAASMAKAAASEAYLQAAKEAIQFHGGIGFTWENDTHLWFKRAKSSEVFLGTPSQHRERMLQAMGI